jgi:ACS family hexuronate transporter-like MFS transporter
MPEHAMATVGGPASKVRPIVNLRWYIILLFFFATIVSYIDRQALSVNAPRLRQELGLSATEYSYLVTAFLIAYTVGPVIAGRLVDAVGARIGMAIAIAWWSMAASLHAIAGSMAAFVGLRFCLGLGEAGTLPSTIRTVADWFPLRERAMATSIFSAGTAIGAVIAVPVVAFTASSLGWRASFLVTGLLGFLWLVPWLLLYDRPEDHLRLSPTERARILAERVSTGDAAGSPFQVLRYRKAWGVILGRFMVDPVWSFYLFWLPSYLVHQRGFTLSQVGMFGWIPFLATDAGSLTGGWISGRLLVRTGSLTAARRAVLAAGSIGTLAGLPAAYVSDASLCLACICCAAFSIGVWAPTVLTLCADVMPRGAVGTMTGLSSAGAGLGGIILTPLIGWLVDYHSYFPVFVLAALLPQLGFLLLVALVGRVEPVNFEELAIRAPARAKP